MGKLKTRCSTCNNSELDATKEPCSKCAEIQYKRLGCQNHFIATNKNLIKEH